MENRPYRSLAIPAITALFVAALAALPAPLPLPRVAPASFQPPVKGGPAAVESFDNLKKLLRDMEDRAGYAYGEYSATDQMGGGIRSGKLSAAPEGAVALDFAESARTDFSPTNVQVQGVDEADIVKTDGNYIYTLQNAELTVAKATPPQDMAILSRVSYRAGSDGSQNFSPTELYVDNRHLIVIGQSYIETPLPGGAEPAVLESEPTEESIMIEPDGSSYIRGGMSDTAKIIVYDLSDKRDLKIVREAEIEGQYLSSRKIGSSLYIVANKYVDMYRILNEPADSGQARPLYRDTAVAEDFKRVPYSRIKYFPEPSEPSYLMVAGLNLDRPDEEITVGTYLGAGQNIYSSTQSLYVAAAKVDAHTTGRGSGDRWFGPPEQTTAIYKFALADGNVNFAAQGEASGTILNQFSMDEHEGFFRIATTKGYLGGEGEAAAKNNLYVLDAQLKTTGRLENVAPGERIYSVRFMGDRAYMVTFKNVDPLFVIDLKDVTDPRILGELKIPGYSDYLHPYDENHLIGFGKEAVDARAVEGAPADSFAYYRGMKIAIFDVSDVERPVEKFNTVIGDRGTDSELLYNHKALLFDKAKNLLAFPITVMEIKNKDAGQTAPDQAAQYGEQTFSGAYVYDIDLRRGLKLRGKITHGPGAKQNLYSHEGYVNIQRVLYINDALYSVSAQMIKSSDLTTLKELGKLELR